MQFDKRYWWLIGVAMVAHFIAFGCTVYTLETKLGVEADPIAVDMFTGFGYVGALILSSALILGGMISIPYLLRQNEKIGWLALVPELGIVALLVVDAANDVFIVTGHHYLAGITFILLRGFFSMMGLPFGAW